jgi:hypothetical protein
MRNATSTQAIDGRYLAKKAKDKAENDVCMDAALATDNPQGLGW